MKLQNIRSLSEVPATESLEFLWVEPADDSDASLTGGDLPHLPNLKALCLPNVMLLDVDKLPELPNLTCLWVCYYEHSESLPIKHDWFYMRFPALQLFVSGLIGYEREKPFFGQSVAEILMRQEQVCFQNYFHDNGKKCPVVFQKLDNRPKPVEDVEIHPLDTFFISNEEYICMGLEMEMQCQPLRLLYTEESLFLALSVWKIGDGRDDNDGNPVQTKDWAGFELKFTFYAYWETDGCFVKDGVLQVNLDTGILPLYRFDLRNN